MTMSSTKNSHVKVGKQAPPVNHVEVVFPELPPSERAERAARRDCRSINQQASSREANATASQHVSNLSGGASSEGKTKEAIDYKLKTVNQK